ncbi:phytoene desaturase family protein [Govanella unica]|uniref:Pyridine nucleotide-disulfide oxidoreductase domain-containing protein 2 n=1 Tax=Govanella unica TaxID=2975056 RepID=A0A9X3TVX9_9PROT|nr:NAD(P)/FAD-dependent oxidoreductase [Govania unica]MDA5192686.1 NAD(P)/FAD-dependent oxidoreductase [Govania unica]
MSDFDVVVAGGGVNALACASLLTYSGLKVCVVERNPWVGGGAVTREVTIPGFKHDLFGSSHVWIQANADFKKIQPELEKHGLKYIHSTEEITGHPDKNGGPGIVIYKSIDKTVESIAQYSAKDAKRYRQVYDDFALIRDGFIKAFFSPPSPPSTMAQAMEKSPQGLKRLREFSLSARAWVEENFENDFVKSVMLNWAMAPQILPEQEGAGQSFYIMIPAVHVYGQAIPEGGSQMLPESMARYIEANGGQVLTSAPIKSFIIEGGAAKGVLLEDGREIRSRRAVVTSLDPKQSFLKLTPREALKDEFVDTVERYSFGKISIARVHLALTEAPKFTNGAIMSACPFHRIVDSMPQMIKQYAEIAQGIPPSDPFLWSACWTVMDPTRAPAGQHTLIFDTFVSNWLADGQTWADIREDYAQNVLLKKLQQYAPNINSDTILGTYIETRETLEAANPSFVDGTTGGGERIQAQLGYFRPFPGYAHYRSPIKGLYMTGPHCHPGGGISAMGTITANVMLEDFGMKKQTI